MAAVLQLPPAVEVEDFAFHSEEAKISPSHSREQSFSSPPAPPLSTALLPDTRNYSLPSQIYDDYAASRSTSHHEDDEYNTEEDELDHLRAPVVVQSARSSISSFPGSILADPKTQRFSTPTRSPRPDVHADILHHGRSGSLSYKIRSPASRLRDSDRNVTLERDYGSGFRHPSSVRAMQMRDEETFDSEPEQASHHRRSGSRTSNFSRRSAHTSPTKRSSRSSRSTPHKVPSPSKLKKEFPLVLLHCTLLPPTLALKSHITDETLLEEVLPTEYWRRWKILQEKIGENNEVRTRGVLIPHPRDEYDLLEERLLESMELERSRLRKGHYIPGSTDPDSGVGTESERDTENESDTEINNASAGSKPRKCPDCGTRVPEDVEVDRKWEVKVYAANGLMRAGAWAAAWSEMEKVDVEVSVWLPETARREVDARLKELGIAEDEGAHQEHENGFNETEEERRQREIYGSPFQRQKNDDEVFDRASHNTSPESDSQDRGLPIDQPSPQADLLPLAVNYVRSVIQDPKNVFMTLLGVLVLILAMSKPQTAKELGSTGSSISAGLEAPVKLTSVSISTSTEVVTIMVTATATSSALSEPAASRSAPTSVSPDNRIPKTSVEIDEMSAVTPSASADVIEISTDALEPSASNISIDEDAETLVKDQEEPALLEQMVQILVGDDGMIE